MLPLLSGESVRIGRKAAVGKPLSSLLVVYISRAKAALSLVESIHCLPCHPTACRSTVIRFRNTYNLTTSVFRTRPSPAPFGLQPYESTAAHSQCSNVPISGSGPEIMNQDKPKLTLETRPPPHVAFRSPFEGTRFAFDTVTTKPRVVARCSRQGTW